VKNDLLGWFFTVERYPMVEHPEVYCRFRMFGPSGVFVYEYLCNSEPSMMAACFDLAAAGAKRIDAHSGCKPEACVHIVGNQAEGYCIQAKGMVMHPAAFLDIFDGDDAEDVVLDILKNVEKEG
jgi:hypothetical protein